MVFQIIDGVPYSNGIELEEKRLGSLSEERLLERLSDLATIIDNKQFTLNRLMKQRAGFVKFCFDNGVSAIDIAKTLKMTRQRVYKIIESIEEEE